MDAELLAAQISTLNEAIVRLDGRIDAMTAAPAADAEATAAHEARLAALEREHAECQTQLQTLASLTEQLAAAEVREAEAEADAAEAEAELMQQIADAPIAAEVTELEPEPESASVGSEEQRRNSSNWLEKFLVLR